MQFDTIKLVHGVLLSASLLLAACGGGGSVKTDVAADPVSVPLPVAVPAVTSMGTDFFLTIPDHLCSSNPSACTNAQVNNTLIVAGPVATTGEVTFNSTVTPFSITAGGQATIMLDPAVVLTANETVEAKGIHVTAQAPVSVHVISENVGSADGYLALPTFGLGTRYYVMSYASSGFTGSEFAVVATQDNTTVNITPTAAGATKAAGVAFSVTLNSGDTYLLENPAHDDMTGTLVTADNPVALFSGHRCTNVPSGVGYCDYLVEQLPDVTLWGKTFHTSSFSGRARYTVRVMASQDGTTFTTMPAGLIAGVLNAGQFVDVDLTGAAEFVASNPVLLAQFMRGYADDTAAEGDPSMVLVTSAEMGMNDATFGVYGLNGTSGALMNIVTETAELASLKLDNVAVNSALFTPIGGTSIYSIGTIPVATGVHSLAGTAAYSALVYDYGIGINAVSYAYPVATKLSLPVVAGSTGTGCVTEQEDDDSGEHQHADQHDIHASEVHDEHANERHEHNLTEDPTDHFYCGKD